MLVELYDEAGQLVGSQRTNGTGWMGFVDLAPGTYHLKTAGPAAGEASASVTVVAGRVAPAALVLRR
jgi:hypothetical protein